MFTTCDSDQEIDAAVAIVGAGPAGISLALALARAGIDTAVIESGGERPDPWAASLSLAAAIIPETHARIENTTVRRLGGASWIWGGRCVNFDPIDFEPRPAAEAAGWPITYEDATSEATAAAAFLGIGAPQFEARFDWIESGGVLRARLERWCADPRLARAHATEIRQRSHARFYTGLTCTGVALDSDGELVRGLRVKYRSGGERIVTARQYVLAAGGIETARLLLASNEAAPNGIGGESGWLGRGYMGHLQGALADIVLDRLSEEDIDYRRDGNACFVRARLTLSAETIRRNRLLNIAFLADNPPLGDWRHRSSALSAAALALHMPFAGGKLQREPIRGILLGQPLTAGDASRHLRNILSDAPGAAAFAARFLSARLRRPAAPGVFVRNLARRYPLKYHAEQSPAWESRITLSHVRDALGMLRVIVEKRVVSADIESVLKAHGVLDTELRRLGLGRLQFRAPPEERAATVVAGAADGYHQIGVARMSDDAKTGVVDCHCRVHNIANLHIAGSAVFPTSGQANPTFLIVCLAFRLAKRLLAELKGV